MSETTNSNTINLFAGVVLPALFVGVSRATTSVKLQLACMMVMTVFTLGLIIFPIVITASYLVFLNEDDTRVISRWPGLRWLQKYLYSEPEAVGEISDDASLAGGLVPSWGPLGALALTLAFVSLAGVGAGSGRLGTAGSACAIVAQLRHTTSAGRLRFNMTQGYWCTRPRSQKQRSRA